MLQPVTNKVAKWYSLWVGCCVLVALYGDIAKNSAEFGLSAWIYLTISGLPLTLLTWTIEANGSYLCIFMVSAVGLAQWCTVAELNARVDTWLKTRKCKT